jgi:hypothetical protein
VPAVYRHAVRDLGQQLSDAGVTALHLLTHSAASLAAYAERQVGHSTDCPLDPAGISRGSTSLDQQRRLPTLPATALFALPANVVRPEITREQLMDAGWAGERLLLVRAGVDPDIFSPDRRSAGLRESWGASRTRPAIVCHVGLSTAALALTARLHAS